MFKAMGLTKDDLADIIATMKTKDSRWKIRGVDQPMNMAVVLSLEYFLKQNDEKQVKNALSYMICFNYPLFHYKYFRKAEPTESIMAYTINNLSNKYQIKTAGNVWAVLFDTTEKALALQKNGIKKGDDDAQRDDRQVAQVVADVPVAGQAEVAAEIAVLPAGHLLGGAVLLLR